MENAQFSNKSDAADRHARAEELLVGALKGVGWQVSRRPAACNGHRADLLIRRPGASYAVEIKVGPEGRGDRLIPLWSQACLQAARVAGRHAPLAVVAAPQIAPKVAEQIMKFAEDFAPDSAAGVLDFEGLMLFRGPKLESLNLPAPNRPSAPRPKEQSHLFSDLNQWMLKVLLAPEIPDALLSAPRGRYRNASQLARAANVSVMSAFRLIQQLQREGYLHESPAALRIVRREEFFRRWQASALRMANEMPMRFLLRGGDSRRALRSMLDSGRACLALFAAADALGLGHVRGVPPHVYVQKFGPANLAAWKNLVPAAPGEAPDVILREAPAPQSVFRGLVRPDGLASCDILQVWLDVFAHPARGHEQAELIQKRVLQPILQGSAHE